MAFTDNGITSPVAKAAESIVAGRMFINRDLIRNAATLVIGPIALAPWHLTTQISAHVTA